MHIYDYIIIGSGLTGLTIGSKISKETENILILEGQETPGGDNRPASVGGQVIENGLRFFPQTETAQNGIQFLEELLGNELTSAVVENNVETYDASGFKKFVGFGDDPPSFYDQISYFLNQEEIPLRKGPSNWIQQLTAELAGKIQTRSQVTRFGFEDLDSANPRLTHVIVNGSKQVYAHNFIFAGQVKDLGQLLPDDVLNPRAKNKLKKSKAWHAVCLDLFHPVVTEKTNLFLLDGTTEDDLGPCIGRYLPANEAGQVSQWVSFLDSESIEETENIGLVLKKMKRQIKRAFPNLAAVTPKERIFVTPALSGSEIKLTAAGNIPKVANLWISCSQVGLQPNLVGSLTQAQLTLAALGFRPSEIQKHIEIPTESDTETEIQL